MDVELAAKPRLYWPDSPCLTETTPHPTHKLPMATSCQAAPPPHSTFWGCLSYAGNIPWSEQCAKSRENSGGADHYASTRYNITGQIVRICGPVPVTMGLSVICDFCGSPQTHNWQRIWCYIGLTALSLTEWHPPNPQITGGKFPGNLVPSCAFLATQIQQ